MTWQTDADLAGTLYRKSKVYTAMLLARCVEPGAGQGTRTDFGSDGPKLQNGENVSSTAFSGYSEIPRKNVDRHLRTWDAMATAWSVNPGVQDRPRSPGGFAPRPGTLRVPSQRYLCLALRASLRASYVFCG